MKIKDFLEGKRIDKLTLNNNVLKLTTEKGTVTITPRDNQGNLTGAYLDLFFEERTCPSCDSTNVVIKPSKYEQNKKTLYCFNCGLGCV